MFFKTDVLKKFLKLTEKHLSSYFIKKTLQRRCFNKNFVKFLIGSFIEYPYKAPQVIEEKMKEKKKKSEWAEKGGWGDLSRWGGSWEIETSILLALISEVIKIQNYEIPGIDMAIFITFLGLKVFNFTKKRLQHRYFRVKFAKCLRTPMLKNIWERLLLKLHLLKQSSRDWWMRFGDYIVSLFRSNHRKVVWYSDD